MPAHPDTLDADGQWITVHGRHVHTDSSGTVDGGGYPGMKTGSPYYDGFPAGARRDLGREPKLPTALVRHGVRWAESLSPDELAGVARYTDSAYKAVNDAAKRCPETLDCLSLRAYRTYAAMRSALRKAGDLPRPVVAYRGFRSTPERKAALLGAARAALRGGATLTLPGFQSMSLDPVTASMFAGMTGHHERDDTSGGLVFEVTCKSGAPVGWSDHVSMFGNNEQELVVNHNSKYKVTGIEPDVRFGSGGARHTVVKLEQLDDGNTALPKNPQKPGLRGKLQALGAAAADLIGLAADDVVVPPDVLAACAGVVFFGDAPAPFRKPFPKKKGLPVPPAGARPEAPKPPPFRVAVKQHNQAVEKNKEAMGVELPGHGTGPVTAKEKSLRDTHKKMSDHLAKRAMAGHWGPAEDGLQRMHDHLTGVLGQHDAHHARKHAEAEQVAHHEASQKAAEDAQKVAEEEAASAPPPEPDIHPAERLAMEKRAKRRAARKDKRRKLEKLMAGRDGGHPELAGLPPSVRASVIAKSGEAPAPKVLGEGDDEKPKKLKDRSDDDGRGDDRDDGERNERQDRDRDAAGDGPPTKDRKAGKSRGDRPGPTPSTEEQANAILSYKVKLHVPLVSAHGLTTDTNTGVNARRLTVKVREAADPAAIKRAADRHGGGTRDAVVRRVAKALGRPLSSGEADIVDPARPGLLSVRPDGGLVKETRAGVWITPDRFAPPEFVPHSAGLLAGSYGYNSYGPAVPGAETGSGAVRAGSPGAPDWLPDPAPDHGVAVGVVAVGGQKLFVPLGPDHRPLTHQHFVDRRTADLAGKAVATGAVRTKLHFDRPKREWCLLRLTPARGWVETHRFPEGEEAKAEHHLRHALHADLDAAGHDAGVPAHSPPALPHGVGGTRVGPDTLYHATAPDGGSVGDLYRQRETAELHAQALTQGVCDTRLRHDGERWLVEAATGHGWKCAKSFPDHRGDAAEKHFRKRLKDDLGRDDAGGEPEKEATTADLDTHFAKGYKRAKRAGAHAGDGSDVAPALSRHASGVVQAAYAKLRARFGDAAARAIAASGFAQETHGAGLGRKKPGPARFAGGAGAKGDLDPDGHWVTIAHNRVHTDSKGGLDAGGPHAVREMLAGRKPSGKPGTGGNPVPSAPPTNPAAPPSGRGNKGKHAPAGKPVAAPGGGKSSWGSWLAALGGSAAVAHARKEKLGGPTIRGPQDRGSRGGSGRGGSGRGGKSGKGGKGGVSSAGQHKFNKAALIGIADFLKKVQTGGVDTTGHGNTAVNIGFADARGGPVDGAAVTFGLPTRKKKHRLTGRHIKALGRIFMEEVRGAMTRAHLTRQDLHSAQERHDLAGTPKTPAAFSEGASLVPRVREVPGTLVARAGAALVAKLEAIIPAQLLRESRVRALEIYPDQTGTQKRADETQREGVRGVRGFFDRQAGLMVVSVVGADCHNFYHELGHSFDHLLAPADWDRIAAEWGGKAPENFAQAFTELCMAVRAGRAARREFARRKPAVCGVLARHGFDAANFSVNPKTRVARAVRAAQSLARDLAALTVLPQDYHAGRRAAGVRVADAVSEFAAAVAPAAPPAAAADAVGEFSASAFDLLDHLDDVIHAGAGGRPQARFAAGFGDALAALVPAALAAAAALAATLAPAAAARELATAVAFGWQDEVRDSQGRWTEGGGPSAAADSVGERAGHAVDHPPEHVRSLIEARPDRANLPPRDQLSVLPPPPPAGSHPTAIREWATKVSEHPYVKEAERLVQAARAAGATTGNLHWDPDAAGGHGDFTPERKKVHDEIAAHVLNPAAAAGPGERPKVAFVLGPPGSGKTSMGRPAARAAMGLPQDRTTTLDPDEVKMSLPEYKGWNAALVHDESAEVFDRLLEKAVADRHHVVFDTTGRSHEFMAAMLDKFARAGYDAHLVHTHLSGEESARRAVSRFVDQAFTDSSDPEKRGRYVPVSFIAEHIDGHPERVYDKLKEDPRVKSWVSYDANDLKAGKIRNSGTRPSTAA